jgi:hypothetical protein
MFCAVILGRQEILFADVVLDNGPEKIEETLNPDHPQDDFMKEHWDEIRKYNGEFVGDDEKKEIYVWTYPYSDEAAGHIKAAFSELPFMYLYYEEYEMLWGYVQSDEMQGWICINAPEVPFFNRNLAGEDVDCKEKDKFYDKENKWSEKQVLLLVTGLVTGLIAVTGILMKVFWKKEKEQ